jgi:phosphoribosylglycinamide formyltransferase 1
MIKVAVFASGSGTNAENLVKYFANNQHVRIHRIFTNNANAGVIGRAERLKVPCEVFSKTNFDSPDGLIRRLKEVEVDFIVLAGFLLLIPPVIINAYKDRIINIHPALLPLHGGKGFYGSNVHQSVIDSGAIMSGITIHYVNEKFDEGEIIFQAACHVSKDDTADSLAGKIHALEYSNFPVVVEKIAGNLSQKK